MIYKIFALKDRAAKVFGQPMFSVSEGGQVRAFSDEINRPDDKNMLYLHPDDFDLYRLGDYDDESGSFVSYPAELVVMGRSLKKES